MSVYISGFASWSGEAREDVAPAGDMAIPGSVRRRLNKFGRSVGNVASEFMSSDPLIVFASRYGDAERAVGILQEIAAGEPISPMQFSLSVHNAVSGVLSIGWKNTEMQSVISAGEQTFEMGLTESYSLALAFPEKEILLIYADFPLPEIFDNFEDVNVIPKIRVILLKADIERSGGVVFDLNPSGDTKQIASVAPLQDLEALFTGQRERVVIGQGALKWEVRKYVA